MRRKRRSRGRSQGEAAEEAVEAAQEESRSERRKAQLARWRDKFIQNLQSAGLLMEKVHFLSTLPFMQLTMIFLKVFSLLSGGIIQCKEDHTLSEAPCSMGCVGVLC